MSKTSQIYQKVTENILGKLETAGSWQKLWQAPTPISLNNHIYTGINFLLLSSDAYETPVYGTFNQIRANGGQVKKGEKSTIIVFWDKLVDKDPDSDLKDVKFFLKYYNVFNIEQAEFDDLGKQKIETLKARSGEYRKHQKSMSAEELIACIPDKPSIVHDKSDRSYYSRFNDRIVIPSMNCFHTSSEYYATLFHELVHSTGHKNRLNRFEMYKDFEDSHMQQYSKEELVAELGASFLSAVAGLDHDIRNSAAYIAGWSKKLADQHTWLVWAAKKAEQASDYLLQVTKEQEVSYAA